MIEMLFGLLFIFVFLKVMFYLGIGLLKAVFAMIGFVLCFALLPLSIALIIPVGIIFVIGAGFIAILKAILH